MALTHTPGVLLSVESLHALLASHIDRLECGIEKGITQEIGIVYRKVYDQDLDAGVHSLLPEAGFAGIGQDSISVVWSEAVTRDDKTEQKNFFNKTSRRLSALDTISNTRHSLTSHTHRQTTQP